MSSDNLSAAFRFRSREVVNSFLQSVVVLDDLAALKPSAERSQQGTPSGSLRQPEYPDSLGAADTGAIADAQDASLDAKAVISGFADIGSVCAVLSPGPADEFRERTVRAARRADIVVLDWKIHESYGDKAMEVLREIIEHEQYQRRLRLVAIYTAHPDLRTIFDRVQSEVEGFYEGEAVELSEEDLRLSKGPLHMVILAKEGTLGEHRPDLKGLEVSDSELANRLADEFVQATSGLLQNVAMAGIAAIRDNAHRIIAKFNGILDAAYLGHRLTLPNPSDAEDHVLEALGAEVVTVLEESRSGERVNVDAIQDWLNLRADQGLNLAYPFPFAGSSNPIEGWRKLLLSGIDSCNPVLPTGVKKNALARRSTEPFAEDSEAALKSNRKFATLLNLKSRYLPARSLRLTVGAILCADEDDTKKYFLCLQPKCDSVRLRAITGFPLINLIPIKEVTFNSKGVSLRMVVELGEDQWIYLGILTKPSELAIRFFEPGQYPPGEVVASEGETGKLYFKDTEGKCYLWLAQMKDEHALGVAGEIASGLARPGPNDSEWLRRASGPPN